MLFPYRLRGWLLEMQQVGMQSTKLDLGNTRLGCETDHYRAIDESHVADPVSVSPTAVVVMVVYKTALLGWRPLRVPNFQMRLVLLSVYCSVCRQHMLVLYVSNIMLSCMLLSLVQFIYSTLFRQQAANTLINIKITVIDGIYEDQHAIDGARSNHYFSFNWWVDRQNGGWSST